MTQSNCDQINEQEGDETCGNGSNQHIAKGRKTEQVNLSSREKREAVINSHLKHIYI